MRVTAQQNDTLDLLCWRHLGSTAGVVEQALQLNPDIASLGTILPIGLAVTLPDQPSQSNTIQMIHLWD
jgi:phage tail protein X